MLKQVYLSYHHENSEHTRAVRRLGEQLQRAGIPVALDQFYLESYPGGPDQGWPRWCADAWTESDCVLVIASPGWFAAFLGRGKPGFGLGSALEAGLLRQDLYDRLDDNQRTRLVLVDELPPDCAIPLSLSAWHIFRPFDAELEFRQLVDWISQRLGLDTQSGTLSWPAPIEFPREFANRVSECKLISDLLAGRSHQRILLIEGESGIGKSTLVGYAARYARRLGIPVALVSFRDEHNHNTASILEQIALELGDLLPGASHGGSSAPRALLRDLRALERPVLLLFDEYERAEKTAETCVSAILSAADTVPGLIMIVAGQRVPEASNGSLNSVSRHVRLERMTRLEDWEPWVRSRYPTLTDLQVHLPTLLLAADGNPRIIAGLSQALSTSGLVAEGNAERYQRELEIRAKEGFERNRERGLNVSSLSTQFLPFFGTLDWRLEPQLNVLLGRNGYGKSHLLRLVAALLARDGTALLSFFGGADGQVIRLQLSDPALPAGEIQIQRQLGAWADDVSKVPVLAIGDTRFIERSRRKIERPAFGADEVLPEAGALHFIRQNTSAGLMENSLFLLCLDVIESGRSRVLDLVHHAIAQLTDSAFEIVDIRRPTRAEQAFEILVRTEGSPEPVYIQQASQGTLSVLGIVLQIYYYLAALYPQIQDAEELRNRRAIVLIDEVDAHLHPSWQKRILGTLRETFPAIQLIVSAHSPLIVAGCRAGEVATLQRNTRTGGIEFRRFERDFIGWDPAEILRWAQDVEPADDEFLRLRTIAVQRPELQREAVLLRDKKEPTDRDNARLDELARELEGIDAAERKAASRLDRNKLEGKVRELEQQVRQLLGQKPPSALGAEGAEG